MVRSHKTVDKVNRAVVHPSVKPNVACLVCCIFYSAAWILTAGLGILAIEVNALRNKCPGLTTGADNTYGLILLLGLEIRAFTYRFYVENGLLH